MITINPSYNSPPATEAAIGLSHTNCSTYIQGWFNNSCLITSSLQIPFFHLVTGHSLIMASDSLFILAIFWAHELLQILVIPCPYGCVVFKAHRLLIYLLLLRGRCFWVVFLASNASFHKVQSRDNMIFLP